MWQHARMAEIGLAVMSGPGWSWFGADLSHGQVVIDELASHLARHPSQGPLFVKEVGAPLAYRRWRMLWAGALRRPT